MLSKYTLGEYKVEVDISQSIRDHIEKLIHHHEPVVERSMRKLEIEREY